MGSAVASSAVRLDVAAVSAALMSTLVETMPKHGRAAAGNT